MFLFILYCAFEQIFNLNTRCFINVSKINNKNVYQSTVHSYIFDLVQLDFLFYNVNFWTCVMTF